MNKKQFSKYIKEFDFKSLFINLGWDNFQNVIPVVADDCQYNLKGIAQKRGFAIVECPPDSNGEIPLINTRKKIENNLKKIHQEHLIIYTNFSRQKQIWQFVIEEADKPRRVREIPYNTSQDTEILYQRARGLLFNLEEEDRLTLVDVTSRVRENLAKNSEKVTKRFYTHFKKHYNSFLGFIEGIDDLIKDNDNKDKQWYASVMMNRLMFCYFIQKRGYLDNDINYLQNKLKEVRKQAGRDQFYLFYRQFLLKLFHQGLGMPRLERRLDVELGNIPYLNGGLFDVHELEKKFPDIQIRDEAFEKIFYFFDQWNWHLDTRIEASGKDINPDVIGYIFEKYINDRAAMGAYYTKEDITDYISKNTIIPSLFDRAKERYPAAFQKDGYIWSFLKTSGDAYIYDAVKTGIKSDTRLFDDLPDDIKKGFSPELEKKHVSSEGPHLYEVRKLWNKKAPTEIALPTETYRELIERRKRYAEIKEKIKNGEITEINDFITYNLNIRQFTQDILENADDPNLIQAFFKVIAGNSKHKDSTEKLVRPISILDPTCGSGAFLFAAMNILEPLYEACIEKMEQFTSETPRKYKYFHKVLAEINSEEHPNLKYYIYKSIILNNLYGVDIMHEAVEIAKLRLFLKMIGAADVDNTKPNYDLEPLPDIDFNIKAGNTLVGFATKEELLSAIEKFEGLYAKTRLEKYKEECSLVATAYERFQDAQFVTDVKSENQRNAKIELQNRLNTLNDKLNEYLAYSYGVTKFEEFGGKTKLFNSENTLKQHTKEYQRWLKTHQPFHWFAEFYEIVNENGGFDVIIGNPPYVEYSKIKKYYKVKNYNNIKAGNLYTLIIERSFNIQHKNSYNGMIIQLSAFCTPRMYPFQENLFNQSSFSSIAFFDDRPGKLFDGLEHIRVAININKKGQPSNYISTTNYIKFITENRSVLFDLILYFSNDNSRIESSILKVNNTIEHSIIEKIWRLNKKIRDYRSINNNNNFIYYGYGYGYFGKILNRKSYFVGEKINKSTGDKYYYINENYDKNIFVGLLNSNLFYWFYINYSDGHNFTKTVIDSLPFNYPDENNENNLITLVSFLMKDLENKARRKTAMYKTTGQVTYNEYYPKKSKHITDEIDVTLAQHYGFTEEELDFIINYDIKYRMGDELDNYIEQLGK